MSTPAACRTAGSRILEGYRCAYASDAEERLSAAGAVLLGKTNLDEFAMGSSNENSAYGPVHNPWDDDPRAGRQQRRIGRGGGIGPGATSPPGPIPAAASGSLPRSPGSWAASRPTDG